MYPTLAFICLLIMLNGDNIGFSEGNCYILIKRIKTKKRQICLMQLKLKISTFNAPINTFSHYHDSKL